MTAEEELNRIENKRVGLGNYTFKEMVWFAEYYAKKQVEQLTIHSVSNTFVCKECGNNKKAVDTTLGVHRCSKCRSTVN